MSDIYKEVNEETEGRVSKGKERGRVGEERKERRGQGER